ncbi:MAG: hypothetical protein IAI49_16875 [Candidatus Eremiobacteraeota bacterium]|nr:hypothetical protein [Candidatus Eremiobacteraeota bacterium]
MSLVVTGLSQNGDITALKTALGAAGISLDPLQVIGPDDSAESVAHGIVGADLYVSEGGTGVPGINNPQRSGGFFRNEALGDRLGDLEIPDSEVDNYIEALERGRSVVAYFAHADTIDRVEELFRTASLTNVRRF